MAPILTTSLAALAVFFMLCMIVPAPTRALLPLTVAAPELSPWIAVFDLVGLALAIAWNRRLIVVFIAAFAVSAWPAVWTLAVRPSALLNTFRIGVSTARPESLAMGIRFYRPPARSGVTLIMIYGGAWQRGTPGDDAEFASYMAARGHSVFAIDYSHAPQFRYPAQLVDVQAAISWIHANAGAYHADPTRIVLCGRSSGGHLALLAGFQEHTIPIRAIIAFYAPTDLERGYRDVPFPDPIGVRSVLEAFIGGPPDRFPQQYREASPVTYAGSRVPPVLLLQGSRDHIVKPVFSRTLHERLRTSGNRSTLIEFPWSEHAFDAIFNGVASQLSLLAIDHFLTDTVVGERTVTLP